MFKVLTIGKNEIIGIFHSREMAEAISEKSEVPTRIVVTV
jgi:hypothetical protein